MGEETNVASSSAAAQAVSLGVTWTHVVIDVSNDPNFIFGLSPGGGGGGGELLDGGKIGGGLSLFAKAAVNQLESQLSMRGLKLEKVIANSISEVTSSLVSFAKTKGATELHTIASRDPWSMEADTLLRNTASENGISLVLHDEQFLIHPHTLVSESSTNITSSTTTDGSETDNSSNQLPVSLRSFDGFCRLLSAAPELKRGEKKETSQPLSSVSISASTSLLENFPAAIVILSSSSSSPSSSSSLLSLSSSSSFSSEKIRQVLAPSDALVDDIGKHRQAQGLSLLSSTQALVVAISGMVYSRCFDPKTMNSSCTSSIYVRQSSAPPIIQSLIASGLLQPRQLWIECATLTAACRSLQQVYDETKRSLSTISPLTHPSSPLLLNFCLEYTHRLVRWLSIREFASHVLYFKPQFAYSPARADMTPLPWAALPDKKPKSSQTSSIISPSKAVAIPTKVAHSPPPPVPAPASTSWWGSFVGETAATESVSVSPPSDWSVASMFGANDDVASLSKQLKTLFDDVSGKKFTDAFLLGQTGYPLVDAAMRSLRSTGHFPPLLIPMLVSYWTKHLGRPWHDGMRLFLLRSVDSDVPLAVLRWQWFCGFLGGVDWAIAVDAVDVLSGFDIDRSPVLAAPSWKSKVVAKEGSGGVTDQTSAGPQSSESNLLIVLYRFLKYPPHPHSMGHPSGLEFGADLDPCGLFVRKWLTSPLGVSIFSISPLVPDAYIHEPNAMPPALTAAAGQAFSKPLSSVSSSHAGAGSLNKHVYATPITSLAKARSNTLECVVQLHKKLKKPSMLASVLKLTSSNSNLLSGVSRRSDVGALEHVDTTPILAALNMTADRYHEQQGRAGCESDWGLVSGAPLLVEEDGDVLMVNANAKKEDSWEELAIDATTETVVPPLRLVVSAQIRSDLPIRPHLANISLLRHSDAVVHESVANLKKYGQWDLSFMRAEEISQLDPFTQACYLIGDPPPPPFSYMFPQRDFVFFRHSLKQPGSGHGRIIIKTGAHLSRAPETIPNYKYVRAEVIGTVGFLTRPIALQPGCLSATMFDENADNGGALTQKAVPVELPVSTGASPSGEYLCTPISEAFSPPGWILPPGDSAMTQIVLYSAGDPKGNIPSFIINAVAKRTPRKWADRLSKFCDKEIGYTAQ